MALKALVSSLDEVPESLRGEYAEIKDGPRKGKFVLSVEGAEGYGLDDLVALKETLSKERKIRSEYEGKLKAFGDLDAAAAREAMAQLEKLKGALPKDQVDQLVQSKIGEFKAKAEAERAELEKRLEQLDQSRRALAVRSEAMRALAALKGNPDLLLPLIERVADPVWQDGQDLPSVRIKDADGSHMVTRKSGSTDPMGIEEYVTVLRDKYPQAFEGHGNTGSGANGATTGAGGRRSGPFTISREDARNHAKYVAAREAAAKAGAQLQVTD